MLALVFFVLVCFFLLFFVSGFTRFSHNKKRKHNATWWEEIVYFISVTARDYGRDGGGEGTGGLLCFRRTRRSKSRAHGNQQTNKKTHGEFLGLAGRPSSIERSRPVRGAMAAETHSHIIRCLRLFRFLFVGGGNNAGHQHPPVFDVCVSLVVSTVSGISKGSVTAPPCVWCVFCTEDRL